MNSEEITNRLNVLLKLIESKHPYIDREVKDNCKEKLVKLLKSI